MLTKKLIYVKVSSHYFFIILNMTGEKKNKEIVEEGAGGAKRRRIEELLDRKRDLKLLSGKPEDPKERAERLRRIAVASGMSEARYKRLTTAEKENLFEQLRQAVAEAFGNNNATEA